MLAIFPTTIASQWTGQRRCSAQSRLRRSQVFQDSEMAGLGTALTALLRSAPSIGQLLYMALSRSRELDADASALDLIDRPHALVAALNKLEQFHAHAQLVPIQAMDDGVTRLLRSHPTAYERVGFLAQLAL
jgi:heat shock protein HtpX